jgi:hypothetical protein
MYKGDTIESIIKECGQPSSRSSHILSTNTVEEWIYFTSHPYDPGYSQYIIDFTNNSITRIHVNEYYTLYQCRTTLITGGSGSITSQFSCGDNFYDTGYTNFCGMGFGIGDSMQTVLAECGPPASKQTLQSQVQERTELIYGTDRPTTLIFDNGKLVDWRE